MLKRNSRRRNHTLPDNRIIQASGESAPDSFRLVTASGDFELLAAADNGEGKKLPRFSVTAYTGVAMNLAGFYRPVVVDLAGMKIPSQQIPAALGHDLSQIVGHTEKIEVSAQRIKAQGVVSGVGEAAKEVTGLAANGFKWQMSCGWSAQSWEYLEDRAKATVNGKVVTGPAAIARQSTLYEISFVPIGADGATSAQLAAKHNNPKESDMDFAAWLLAKGVKIEDLNEATKTLLKAQYDAEQNPPPKPNPAPATPPITASGGNVQPPAAPQSTDIVAQAAADYEYVVAIQAAATKYKAEPELVAKALKERWTVGDAKLEFLQASRPSAPLIHTPSGPGEINAQVIEAAVCQTLNIEGTDQAYTPQILQAAHTHFRGRMGIQQLLLLAARQNGYDGGHDMRVHDGNLKRVLRFAFAEQPVRAGFTSLSLPNAFSNVANKTLLVAFNTQDQSWREIAKIGSVSDFKQVTRIRPLDTLEFDEIGKGGQLKHGQMDEETLTNQAKTYGKMLAFERQDIINDDMGVLNDRPAALGQGAGRKLAKVVWTKFLSATFFTSTNGNYIEGATTNLSYDSLKSLKLKTRQQTDAKSGVARNKGQRINIETPILLVPAALEDLADQLMNSEWILQATGSDTTLKYPEANTMKKKYRPVMSRYLDDDTITGYSATAFYLVCDPKTGHYCIEVVFLNGNQTPTFETADVDFSQLGIQMRSIFDAGCELGDFRAVYKSKGAA